MKRILIALLSFLPLTSATERSQNTQTPLATTVLGRTKALDASDRHKQENNKDKNHSTTTLALQAHLEASANSPEALQLQDYTSYIDLTYLNGVWHFENDALNKGVSWFMYGEPGDA